MEDLSKGKPVDVRSREKAATAGTELIVLDHLRGQIISGRLKAGGKVAFGTRSLRNTGRKAAAM